MCCSILSRIVAYLETTALLSGSHNVILKSPKWDINVRCSFTFMRLNWEDATIWLLCFEMCHSEQLSDNTISQKNHIFLIVKFPVAMRRESFSLPVISCLMACPPCRETTPPNNELRNNPNDHPQWVYYRPRQHLAQAVDTPIFCLNSNFLSSCTSQRRLRIRHTSIKFTFCKVLLFS